MKHYRPVTKAKELDWGTSNSAATLETILAFTLGVLQIVFGSKDTESDS